MFCCLPPLSNCITHSFGTEVLLSLALFLLSLILWNIAVSYLPVLWFSVLVTQSNGSHPLENHGAPIQWVHWSSSKRFPMDGAHPLSCGFHPLETVVHPLNCGLHPTSFLRMVHPLSCGFRPIGLIQWKPWCTHLLNCGFHPMGFQHTVHQLGCGFHPLDCAPFSFNGCLMDCTPTQLNCAFIQWVSNR